MLSTIVGLHAGLKTGFWPKFSINYGLSDLEPALSCSSSSKTPMYIPNMHMRAQPTIFMEFSTFCQKFPRSKMGVAILNFPQGLEFYNFFLGHLRPYINYSNHQTLVTNFFTDGPIYQLIFPYYIVSALLYNNNNNNVTCSSANPVYDVRRHAAPQHRVTSEIG